MCLCGGGGLKIDKETSQSGISVMRWQARCIILGWKAC